MCLLPVCQSGSQAVVVGAAVCVGLAAVHSGRPPQSPPYTGNNRFLQLQATYLSSSSSQLSTSFSWSEDYAEEVQSRNGRRPKRFEAGVGRRRHPLTATGSFGKKSLSHFPSRSSQTLSQDFPHIYFPFQKYSCFQISLTYKMSLCTHINRQTPKQARKAVWEFYFSPLCIFNIYKM